MNKVDIPENSYSIYSIYILLVYTEYILDRNTGNGEND